MSPFEAVLAALPAGATVSEQQPGPGLLAVALPLDPGLTLAEFRERYLPDVPAPYALHYDGCYVRPEDFAAVELEPGKPLEIVFRAENNQTAFTFLIAAASIFALAAEVPAIWVAVGATAARLGGTVLIKPPGVRSPQRDPDDSENGAATLSSAQNQARLGDPIPEIIGKRLHVPDLIAQPYTHYVAGDVQRLRQIMAIGMGEYQLHEVRIGDQLVWANGQYLTSAVAIEYLRPGAASNIYPHRVVVADSLGRPELKWVNAQTWSNPVTIGGVGERLDRLEMDIEFPSGLVNVSGGGFTAHAVSVQWQYRAIDDDGTPLMPWTYLTSANISRTTLQAVRTSVAVDVAPRRYEVRAQIASAQTYNQNYVNRCFWTQAKGFVVNGNSAGNYSRLGLLVSNTEEISAGSALLCKVLVTRKLPHWSPGGGWTPPVATDRIAAGVSHLLRDSNCGNLPDSAIDLPGLWSVLQPTWTAAGDSLNAIRDVRVPVVDSVRQALQAGRSDLNMIGGQLQFYRDEARTVPAQMFGRASIVRDSFQIEAAPPVPDDYTHIDVEYPDATLDYQRVVVKCSATGMIGNNGQTVALPDVTDRSQAWRLGVFFDAVRRYRRTNVAFGTELAGRLTVRGDQVRVSHDFIKTWGQSGVVLSLTGNTLELSEEYAWPAGPNYIQIRDRAGKPWGPLLVTFGGGARYATVNAASLAALVSATGKNLAAVLPNDGNYAPYSIGNGTNIARNVLLTEVKPRSGNTYQMTGVIDDPRVYTATAGQSVPPRENVVPIPGTPAAAPNVTGLDVVFLSGDEIRIAIQVVAGAVNYEVNILYTNGFDAGTTSGPSTTVFRNIVSSSIEFDVRVRAFGTAWGAWYSKRYRADGNGGLPLAATGLAADGAYSPPDRRITWARAYNASHYTVTLKNGATYLSAIDGIEGTSGGFTAAQVAAAGGPLAGVTVGVIPQSAAGNGPEATIFLGQPLAIAITGVTPSLTSLQVATSAGAGTAYGPITGYVVAYSTTPGFDPETASKITSANRPITVPGLVSDTTYYLRAAAYVGSAANLHWSAQTAAMTSGTP